MLSSSPMEDRADDFLLLLGPSIGVLPTTLMGEASFGGGETGNNVNGLKGDSGLMEDANLSSLMFRSLEFWL